MIHESVPVPAPPTDAAHEPGARPRRLWASVAAVAALGLAAATYLVAAPPATSASVVTGVAEGTDVDLAFKLPGRVAAVRVEEGQAVAAGQTLATLTSEELLAKRTQAEAALALARVRAAQAREGTAATDEASAAQLRQAQAGLELASAQLDTQRNGARPEERVQLEAKLRAARSAEEAARFSFEAVRALYAEGGVTRVKLDEVRAQHDKARAEREAAEQQLRMGRAGARKEQIEASRAQLAQATATLAQARAGRRQVSLRALDAAAADAAVRQAQGALDEVTATIGNTRLSAPVSGVVRSVLVEPGELVAQGMTVLTLEHAAGLTVKFYLDETRLGDLGPGARRTLYVPALGREVPGRVIAVSNAADFATRKATRELGDRDVRAFQVKFRLDDAAVRPGHTVEWAPGREAGR